MNAPSLEARIAHPIAQETADDAASLVRLPIPPRDKIDDDGYVGQFIPLHYHGQMLANRQRMNAFSEAIAKLVPVGAEVLELGAGTGVLSYLAAQNAAHVTCIERIPHVAAACRRLLHENGVADRVTVLEGDAFGYVPDRPVDVVICEMLHVGLLREKQVALLNQFKRLYLENVGGPLPRFIPEASLLAVQPVQQQFEFHGYRARLPLFYAAQDGTAPTLGLGAPSLYGTVDFSADIPEHFQVDQDLLIEHDGTLNGLRFITKNLVGIFNAEARAAEWHMQYLVMPLARPLDVRAGDRIRVRFQYDAGDSLIALEKSLQVELRGAPRQPLQPLRG